jgi:hypothetical protein
MKPAVVFIVTFAFTLGFGALFIAISNAAKPVDAFVTPVPATPPGTSAAILPPGTYHAVKPGGMRLSGWIHSPDTSRFPALKSPRPAGPSSPECHLLKSHPQIHFVPVDEVAQSPRSSSR